MQNEFPENLALMSGLQQLKLDRTDISDIPEELGKLGKLEHLSLKNNEIEKLYGELCLLQVSRLAVGNPDVYNQNDYFRV